MFRIFKDTKKPQTAKSTTVNQKNWEKELKTKTSKAQKKWSC